MLLSIEVWEAGMWRTGNEGSCSTKEIWLKHRAHYSKCCSEFFFLEKDIALYCRSKIYLI